MLALILIFLLGLVAGVLSGIVGTGSSMVMLPVLVMLYGPRMAVPMMGIAAVLGNLGRVITWWREILAPGAGILPARYSGRGARREYFVSDSTGSNRDQSCWILSRDDSFTTAFPSKTLPGPFVPVGNCRCRSWVSHRPGAFDWAVERTNLHRVRAQWRLIPWRGSG